MRTLLLLLITTAASLQAQYQIDWSAITAGSNRQTGGVYAVSGAVGQPGSGSLAGGIYSLTIGFWSLDIVQPVVGPRLAVERRPEGVRISWPLAASDGVLEEADTLDFSPVAWRTASFPWTTNGAAVFVTIPVPSGTGAAQAVGGEQVQIPAKKVVRFRKR